MLLGIWFKPLLRSWNLLTLNVMLFFLPQSYIFMRSSWRSLMSPLAPMPLQMFVSSANEDVVEWLTSLSMFPIII